MKLQCNYINICRMYYISVWCFVDLGPFHTLSVMSEDFCIECDQVYLKNLVNG